MKPFSALKKPIYLALIGAGSLISAGPVVAQESDNSLQIEEVVVTARKREENIQETPLSITAITADMIADAHLSDLSSIEAMTPNLNLTASTDGSSGGINAFIRGVGQNDQVITTDPGVGIYVDGVYISRTVGSNLEFNDIERLEVLRGPQGTLFGKNTIGGAINVVTRKPSGETSFNVEATVGEYGYKGISAYAETSLGDNLAASVALLKKDSDGWQKRQGTDSGADDMWGVRAHLLWTPSDTFSSHLVIDNTDKDQQTAPWTLEVFDPTQFLPFLYNTFVSPTDPCCVQSTDVDKSGLGNSPTVDKVEIFGVSWTNEWDLGDMTLKSVTGYRDMETFAFRDSDNSPQPFFSVQGAFDHDQLSQEFILSGNAFNEKMDWVVGAYYFEEDGKHLTDVVGAEGLYDALVSQPLDVFIPGIPVPAAFLASTFDFSLNYEREQQVKSYAAYFHTSYELSDQLNLTVAARYTRDEKDFSLFTFKRDSQSAFVLPGTPFDKNCGDVVAKGPGSTFSCSQEWSEFSPKIGLDYQIDDDTMAYVHVSRGFRSGIFNGRPLTTPEISTADPETLTSYEIGFKTQLMDQRLQLNGAIFYNDYEDQQFLVNKPSDALGSSLALSVANAGESSATGFELEMLALVSETLTFTGGLSYVNPEYDEYIDQTADPITGLPADVDLSHRKFAHTPEWNANVGVQYETGLSGGGTLRARTDVAYKDEIYYTNNDTSLAYDTLNEDAYTRVDAGVTYITSDDQWEFSLYGKNLTDKRVMAGGFDVQGFFGVVDTTYIAPRRYFFSVKYRTQ